MSRHCPTRQGHLKPWPKSQTVQAAVAAAIQRERKKFSAVIASVSRNVSLPSGSLDPGNPARLGPPTASAPGIC